MGVQGYPGVQGYTILAKYMREKIWDRENICQVSKLNEYLLTVSCGNMDKKRINVIETEMGGKEN